jgi:hypothetical protein
LVQRQVEKGLIRVVQVLGSILLRTKRGLEWDGGLVSINNSQNIDIERICFKLE